MRDARQCTGNSLTGHTRVTRTTEILIFVVIPESETSKLEMASLGDVRNQNTIQERKGTLSSFLKENDVGKLSEENSNHFRHIFQQFYTPDKGEKKYENKDIKEVKIGQSGWGDKCFVLIL